VRGTQRLESTQLVGASFLYSQLDETYLTYGKTGQHNEITITTIK